MSNIACHKRTGADISQNAYSFKSSIPGGFFPLLSIDRNRKPSGEEAPSGCHTPRNPVCVISGVRNELRLLLVTFVSP